MTEPVRALTPIPLYGLVFDVAGTSARGPRAENQDAFAVDTFPAHAFVAVADGLGGERAGRLAADTALDSLARGGEIRSADAARYAVRAADEAVARAAHQNPAEREGMACAIALLALAADRHGELRWIGAHVGDVRILSRAPDGTVRLETRDHTPAFARWEAGEIALDEIPDSPGANRLQRAVGRGGEADTVWLPVRPGWSYLLVSDGVTKAMRLDELGDAMALPSAAAAVEAIARKVEERGPDDNYTSVAVRVSAEGAAADTLPAPPPAAPPRGAPRNVFDPPGTVNRTRNSPWGPVAAVLAVLALAVAGFALWTAWQNAGAEALRAEVVVLQARVDSLRALVAPPEAAGVAPADTVAAGTLAAPAPGTATPTTP